MKLVDIDRRFLPLCCLGSSSGGRNFNILLNHRIVTVAAIITVLNKSTGRGTTVSKPNDISWSGSVKVVILSAFHLLQVIFFNIALHQWGYIEKWEFPICNSLFRIEIVLVCTTAFKCVKENSFLQCNKAGKQNKLNCSICMQFISTEGNYWYWISIPSDNSDT